MTTKIEETPAVTTVDVTFSFYEAFLENRTDPKAQMKMAALAAVLVGPLSAEERVEAMRVADKLISWKTPNEAFVEVWGAAK